MALRRGAAAAVAVAVAAIEQLGRLKKCVIIGCRVIVVMVTGVSSFILGVRGMVFLC